MIWSALAAIVQAICTGLLKAWQGHNDAVETGEQKVEISDLKAADAAVDKAQKARDATAAVDANPDSLHAAEQSDPDCRDCTK